MLCLTHAQASNVGSAIILRATLMLYHSDPLSSQPWLHIAQVAGLLASRQLPHEGYPVFPRLDFISSTNAEEKLGCPGIREKAFIHLTLSPVAHLPQAGFWHCTRCTRTFPFNSLPRRCALKPQIEHLRGVLYTLGADRGVHALIFM
jgi:hypothetical protein